MYNTRGIFKSLNKKMKTVLTCFLAIALSVAGCVCLTPSVFAATVSVDTFAELENACQKSGTVQITGKIAVTDTITVPKGVTVYLTCSHAAGSTTTDIYRAQGFHGHLFKVNDGATLYVRCAIDGNNKDGNGNLRGTGATGTESSGYYGQSLILNYGNVIMDNDKSVLKNNYNAYNNDYKSGLLWTYGGVKYYGLSASPESTSLAGSAILCVNGKFTMSNGQIYGCYADNGPAIYVCNGYSGDTIKVSGGTIKNNVARRYGGAVFAASRKPYSSYSDSSGFVGSRTLNSTGSNAMVTISGGNICNNLARLNSGGIWVGFGGTFYMSGGSVYNNVAVEEGGGGLRLNAGGAGTTGGWMCFANPGGQAWIAGGSIYGNSCATNGAGITIPDNDDANNQLKITGGNIYSNTADSNGGGVYCASKLIVSGGKIYKNTSGNNGGGAYLTGTGTLSMSGGSIYSNKATAHGGGVYLTTDGPACTISGGDIYSNTAEYGGGVATFRTKGLTLSNVKVYNNTANATGGGVRSGNSSGGSLTINSGFYYGNTNIGVYVVGGKATINGGKFGVSAYTDYSTYTVSRNTNSQLTIAADATVTINSTSFPRIVSTLLSGEAIGANKGIVNNGTLTVTNTSSNAFDIYGTGTSVYNAGTFNINGNFNILSSGKDGASAVQKRLGIQNTAAGTVTMNSSEAEIKYCGNRGVLNYGSFNLKAGKIYNCSSPDVTADNGGGLFNSGDSSVFTMSGGEIHNNTANHGGGVYFTTAGKASTISGGSIYKNQAKGSGGAFLSYRTNGVTVSGGSIYSNTAGKYGGAIYIGDSLFNMTGGTVYTNSASTDKGNGVFIAGKSTFKMSKTALVNTNNDVFLNSYNYITVPTAFTGSQNVRALVKGDNFKVGRVVATFGDSTDDKGAQALYWNSASPVMTEQYFTLGKSENVLRSGDQSAAKNTDAINNQDVFISELYTVSFDMNPINAMLSGSVTHNVNSQKHVFNELEKNHVNKDVYSKYWNENAITFNVGHAISTVDIDFKGWSLNEKGEGTIYSADTATSMSANTNKDLVYYAVWLLDKIDVDYDGNGATSGKNWTETVDMSKTDKYTLSAKKDAFARVEENKEMGSKTLFKFMGWTIDDTFYDFGTTVPASVFKDSAAVKSGRKNAVVTAYATWDEYPTISAVDRWFTLDEVEDGKITLEELMKTALAVDGEVGDVTDFEVGEGSFTIIDYDADEFSQLTTSGSVTITYKAVDKVGNETYRTVTVHIVDKEQQVIDKVTRFVRFISKEFFKGSDGAYLAESQGGFNLYSVWINNPEYEALLTNVLNNSQNEETGEWDTVYMTIVFTKEDVAEAKEYIDTHGLGNSLESDALAKFYEKFQPQT